MSENPQIIRVGSRKSELALIQTNHVISSLKSIHPDKKFEIITMNTIGDKVLDLPLPKIGEKSLFTKELEAALATGGVDFVVHSLKDLPTCLPENMAIGVVLEREDPRDALVLHEEFKKHSLKSLPKDSTIGTSSLRRAAQLHRYYPHLKVECIRGNLNTRLKKLDNLKQYQAIVLATAGLQRMGWHKRISKIIDDDDILYAVGQGAIAVECRETDLNTISLLKPLYDIQTAIRIVAERTFLKTLGGGCSAPVAVKTDLVNVNGNKHKLKMIGAVWSLDGKDELKETIECEIDIKGSKCFICPYKNCISNGNMQSKTTNVESPQISTKHTIENENDIEEPSYSHVNKKIKLDNDTSCPINLPIGADFMGKCPYLESHDVDNNIPPIDIYLGEEKQVIDKCPFRKEELTIFQGGNKSDVEDNENLFCGLVPHPDISMEVFKRAGKLGKDLADKLIKDGAKDIMIKAQNTIKNC